MAPEDGAKLAPELAGGNSLRAVYPDCSGARLYAAAVRAATGIGFPITSQDEVRMTVSFRTGRPTAAWPGAEMTAAIHQQGDAAQLAVGGTHSASYRLGMIDWHQAKAVGLMFLDRVTSLLPNVPEPQPNPHVSIADQLKSLADMRDRGVLTGEEFDAAKQKLLRAQ